MAATAAVLTAGALPLAAAGTAFASTPQTDPLSSAAAAGLGEKAAELTGKVQVLSAKADFLTAKAGQLTDELGTGAPVRDLLHGVVPPTTDAVPGELAPAVLRNGTVGTLSGGVGQPAAQMAEGFVAEARPWARQLQGSGVPTVGEVTSSLSRTQMPVFGTVGGLTSAVPVGSLVGEPVMDTLGSASTL
jgi:hypothetical protein